MATPAALLAEALTWRGTPFRHAADVKGVGVDCGMFLLRSFQALGLLPDYDPRPYPPGWFLHRTEDRFTPFLRAHGVEVTAGTPQPGDVACFTFGRAPFAHTGFVVRWPIIVHAAPEAGVTLARGDSGPLAARFRAAWRHQEFARG